MNWEDAAAEFNAMPPVRRREAMRALLADLCPDAWLDLLDVVEDERELHDDDGVRDE